MTKLLHHKLDPSSRLIRLIFAEYDHKIDLEEASPYKSSQNLIEIDPIANVPLLIEEKTSPIIGSLAIVHHIEDIYQQEHNSLIPKNAAERAEMWRLFEWVMGKFNDEVSRYFLEEKIGKREQKIGAPDPKVLRAARVNLIEHEKYFAYLFETRNWFAGKDLTLADFALGAHLSCLDYLGEIDWFNVGETKNWYARLKSRPAFRSLLSDRIIGMPASKHYTDLDF